MLILLSCVVYVSTVCRLLCTAFAHSCHVLIFFLSLICLQLGSGKYGDTLRVLAGGGSAANQVEYISKYGSALPVLPTESGEHPDTATIGASSTSASEASPAAEVPNAGAGAGARVPTADEIARSKFL